MEGTVTINISELDRYREIEKAIKHYENGGVVIVDRYINSRGLRCKYIVKTDKDLLRDISNIDERNKALKKAFNFSDTELSKLKDRYVLLSSELEALRESKRPIDVGSWGFLVAAYIVGCIVTVLINTTWN